MVYLGQKAALQKLVMNMQQPRNSARSNKIDVEIFTNSAWLSIYYNYVLAKAEVRHKGLVTSLNRSPLTD